jgi:hypothetical protein
MSTTPEFGVPSTSKAGDSVPLTASQKSRLIVECLPFVFFVVVFILLLTLVPGIISVPPLLYLFMAVVLLVVGYQALQRIRDLVSGIASVQDDLLERAWPSRGRGANRFYGRFAQLGTLRLMKPAYHQGQTGQRHRLYYSPVSKIVWSMEPLQ